MITRSDALKNQKHAKNASKMIKFLCDIFPCNIPSVSHAIWVAAILRYMILRCISVWVPIVFYVLYCKAIFFCSIAYCMLHWCKIPLKCYATVVKCPSIVQFIPYCRLWYGNKAHFEKCYKNWEKQRQHHKNA